MCSKTSSIIIIEDGGVLKLNTFAIIKTDLININDNNNKNTNILTKATPFHQHWND